MSLGADWYKDIMFAVPSCPFFTSGTVAFALVERLCASFLEYVSSFLKLLLPGMDTF